MKSKETIESNENIRSLSDDELDQVAGGFDLEKIQTEIVERAALEARVRSNNPLEGFSLENMTQAELAEAQQIVKTISEREQALHSITKDISNR
jgi:hypothetical protein